MTLQSPTATLMPLFSSSELTGCGYPGLLDRKNHSDIKIIRICAPGESRTLDSLRTRRAPYPLGQALHSSQMFNYVQLYVHVHWMHLLNTRICRFTYVTPTVIYCDQDRFNLEMDSTVFKSGVFLTKFGHKLLLSLSAKPDYV